MISYSRSRSKDMDFDTPKQNVKLNVKLDFKRILDYNFEIQNERISYLYQKVE